MEYIFGFIIQIAGIMLLAKLSWSLLRLLARQSVRPFRFVLTQIKRLLTPTLKRRPMAVPKAPGMPR
ncbi:MAG: plasmid-related protein, partial [Aestuariibacter sp.]|nr:plasmid-related protein [Aestuariibacter sp.]